ncbi:hypothetical protein BROUX41_004918 [Berkeleyomyces rouxiae]|uniref:uncharacterized protein n=1 Tax=Berkeleyomyces rouxiae TaxID=2035830 RepID=UPI003B7A3B9E
MVSVDLSHIEIWGPDDVSQRDLIALLSLDPDARQTIVSASETPAGDPESVLQVEACEACQADGLIQYNTNRRPTAWARFDNFMPALTRCCDALVCKTCVQRSVKQGFHRFNSDHHWTVLDPPALVFKCPLRCRANRDEARQCYRSRVFDEILADDTPYDGMKSYVDRCNRIKLLRRSLKMITPRLTSTELSEIKSFHQQLVDLGFAHDPEHRRLDATVLDKHSVLAADDVEPVKIYKFRRNGHQVRMPILMRYLKRTETRSCWICMDEMRDMHTGDDWEGWKEIWTALGNGSAAFKVLNFPLRLQKLCKHQLDFCKDCLAQHIQVQSRDRANNALGNITCPGQNCERTLRLAEIELYAPQEVRTRYYNLLALARDSDDPNFMWCISGACQHGQIHPAQATEVHCARCNQAMCFQHRGPWHPGQTCAQFDSGVDNATGEWLETNTKACPRCNAVIEKNGGCYHMTCSACRYEFCWDCLCDWSAAGWDLQRHTVQCRFRQAGINPTEAVGGLDVEAAIRDVTNIRNGNPHAFAHHPPPVQPHW